MKTITTKAYGKLNLTLDVLRKRPDGYHDMQMIMQSVDLCDDVTVTIGGEENWTCTCDIDEVPSSLDNLAVKAAEAFYAHGEIRAVAGEFRAPVIGGHGRKLLW